MMKTGGWFTNILKKDLERLLRLDDDACFYVVCVLHPLCKGTVFVCVLCVLLFYFFFLFYCYGHMPDTNKDDDDDDAFDFECVFNLIPP